eukprot:9150385-Alexandrium_andersonii.AAC.1
MLSEGDTGGCNDLFGQRFLSGNMGGGHAKCHRECAHELGISCLVGRALSAEQGLIARRCVARVPLTDRCGHARPCTVDE